MYLIISYIKLVIYFRSDDHSIRSTEDIKAIQFYILHSKQVLIDYFYNIKKI